MSAARLAQIAALALITSSAANGASAQQPAGPPTAFLQSLPEHGRGAPLILGFCLIGSHFCTERTALAWGQVCDSSLAEEMGEGRSGDVMGGLPFLFHYAGWRCGETGRWHDRSEKVFGGGNFGN